MASTVAKSEWRIATDSQGRTYYYNKRTRETSWTKPTNDSIIPPSLPTLPTSTITQTTNSNSVPQSTVDNKKKHDKSHTKSLYKVVIDPITQRKYWYNRITKQSQWNEPTSRELLLTTNSTTTFEHQQENQAITVPKERNPIPEDISKPALAITKQDTKENEILDTNDNHSIISQQPTILTTTNGTIITNNTFSTFNEPLRITPSNEITTLPPGWKQVWDKQSKKYYYYS